MARAARFTADELLDAALELAVEGGPAAVSIAAISRRTGAPSGSVYHRFAGREELLATLWLRTIEEFQQGMIAALAIADTDLAIDACLAHAFDWTAAHPQKTRLLLQFSAHDLVADWPESLGARVHGANRRLREAIADLARRRFGSVTAETVDRTVYALADLPYAAIRRHLPDGRPRPWLREFTAATAHRVLAVGQ
ncbi:TetR/AcrR family transcriptional regulator [Gordonia caeni]|uniref:TetR/AcrR family transcriptional regulator n=1 Tax=Gordonia caeni TaxID=1007097 RepID=A0ABP7NXR8_9ACTN